MGHPRFNGFDHKAIRNQFVSKVYSIVGIQLAVSMAILAWCTLHKPTKEYFGGVTGMYWLYGMLACSLVLMIMITCFESIRRTFPLNLVLLTLLTLSFAIMTAILSARYETYTILCAAGTTAFATFVIYLIAKYSSFDITTCGCGLCILAVVHLIASLLLTIILVPMGYGHTASMLLAGFASFILSLYILFDLQLIMGGRSAELSPEEYILAATLLYVDIIQLFQNILILFGGNE